MTDPPDLEIGLESPDAPDALYCLAAFFQELARRFDGGFDPARSISASPAELTPPAGYFFVARLGGRPVGCGALKIKEDGIGEIKRMWVAGDARGHSIGRRLLTTLEDQARALGLRILRLETNGTLAEAQALYRRRGYCEVAPFSAEPYAHHWFERRIWPRPIDRDVAGAYAAHCPFAGRRLPRRIWLTTRPFA